VYGAVRVEEGEGKQMGLLQRIAHLELLFGMHPPPHTPTHTHTHTHTHSTPTSPLDLPRLKVLFEGVGSSESIDIRICSLLSNSIF